MPIPLCLLRGGIKLKIGGMHVYNTYILYFEGFILYIYTMHTDTYSIHTFENCMHIYWAELAVCGFGFARTVSSLTTETNICNMFNQLLLAVYNVNF